MMTDNNETKKAKLNGCAWVFIVIMTPVVIALIIVLLRILWMFGSWIGAQV